MMKAGVINPLVIATLLINGSAFADESNKPDEETLFVSAKQSPNSASARNVSSTRVSGSTLADARVSSTDRLGDVLPGLNMTHSGSLLFPSISLRGISSAQDFFNPAVSIYVDGVPQLATFSSQLLNGDIESVEMLRGPQGTLYGKSAQGGVINIITRKPDGDLRASVEGGYATRNDYHGRLNASGALVEDMLYASASVQRQVDNGPFTNPATGSDDLGGTKTNNGNLNLRFAPSASPWEASVMLNSECTRASQDTYLDGSNMQGRELLVSAGGKDPKINRCTRSQTLASQYTTEDWLLSLTAGWQQQHYERDFPYSAYAVHMPQDWNMNVQELRAATLANDNPVDAVFGLYRQDTHGTYNQRMQYAGMTLSDTQAWNDAETLAAYGDLTWHLTDKLDLGGGVRFSHDKAKTRYQYSSLPQTFSGETSDNQWLGQLSAGYQFTPEFRVWTRAAQGYKPAGYSIAPSAGTAESYDAEKSINYELGARYDNGDVALQGTVFHTRTKDVQLYSGPTGQQSLTNAGKAKATGVELDASWAFTPGWRAEINGGYVNSTFDGEDSPYPDKRLPFVPLYNAGASINGTIDTPAGALMPRIAVNVVGKHYFDGDNLVEQGTYATTNLRLGWQATRNVQLATWVDNLFDKRYRTYGMVAGPGQNWVQINQGLTAGIDVKIDLF